ncbi:ADP compounds hydrolase [Cellvibrio japonicus Ueda107]|uniref:ADP compounds hydrolase n=2 Tax=Cellvibrio japonicus TaxID=155077 RepID=B3PHB4_CELJU|nr:ADP compounds hydrolase [Cellvibrio japonicus Ueda107]
MNGGIALGQMVQPKKVVEMEVQQGTIHIQHYCVYLIPVNHKPCSSVEAIMPSKPEILNRGTVARSRLFRADEIHLRFSNGEVRTYEKLCTGGPGAVLIVPLLDENTVLLVREYAVGIEDYHLALPKGAMDLGESLLEAANRELKEEVGYGARQLKFLKRIHLSPAYMEHGINLVLAWDLYPERLPGDEPEPIEVVPYPLDRLLELVMRPDVCEGRSIAALFMAREWLAGNLSLEST